MVYCCFGWKGEIRPDGCFIFSLQLSVNMLHFNFWCDRAIYFFLTRPPSLMSFLRVLTRTKKYTDLQKQTKNAEKRRVSKIAILTKITKMSKSFSSQLFNDSFKLSKSLKSFQWLFPAIEESDIMKSFLLLVSGITSRHSCRYYVSGWTLEQNFTASGLKIFPLSKGLRETNRHWFVSQWSFKGAWE